jgi:hypothetical protein
VGYHDLFNDIQSQAHAAASLAAVRSAYQRIEYPMQEVFRNCPSSIRDAQHHAGWSGFNTEFNRAGSVSVLHGIAQEIRQELTKAAWIRALLLDSSDPLSVAKRQV